MRRRSTDYIVKYVHAEDLQTSHIDIGPVNKVINMCVCFHADGANSGTRVWMAGNCDTTHK